MAQIGCLSGIHKDLDSIPRGAKIINKQIEVKREMLLYSIRGYILKISLHYFHLCGGVMLCMGGAVCVGVLKGQMREGIRSPLLELEL